VPTAPQYISALLISKTTFNLGLGKAGIWTATFVNTSDAMSGMSLLGMIQQNDNSVVVNSVPLSCPGVDNGVLPSGACIQQGTYTSVGPDGGSDGLSPGLANFVFDMMQSGQILLDSKTIPVTLLNAP